ncbi:hypothetical protein PIB30_004612 [Stylosanthes scabra]|uniref:Uncharacterized protein n=1 Tax=Stylosanthes scabra TaxID=79078 RepID=A0ABU6Z5R2_9FABA|nr:hypothetical protein [Stylosanthes scabra]
MKICSAFLIISLCVLHTTLIAIEAARPFPLIFDCRSNWTMKIDNYVSRPSRSPPSPPAPRANVPPKPGLEEGVSLSTSPPTDDNNNNNDLIAYKFSSLDFIPNHNTASA